MVPAVQEEEAVGSHPVEDESREPPARQVGGPGQRLAHEDGGGGLGILLRRQIDHVTDLGAATGHVPLVHTAVALLEADVERLRLALQPCHCRPKLLDVQLTTDVQILGDGVVGTLRVDLLSQPDTFLGGCQGFIPGLVSGHQCHPILHGLIASAAVRAN